MEATHTLDPSFVKPENYRSVHKDQDLESIRSQLNSIHTLLYYFKIDFNIVTCTSMSIVTYEGWNFNSGNYLFTTDTK